MEFGASTSHDRSVDVPLHESELIKFRDERRTLLFVLSNGQTLEGTVRWFDQTVIHVLPTDSAGTSSASQQTGLTLFKHAVVHYQAR